MAEEPPKPIICAHRAKLCRRSITWQFFDVFPPLIYLIISLHLALNQLFFNHLPSRLGAIQEHSFDLVNHSRRPGT